MRPLNFDGVIFDLDGVITDTAEVHAAAWKSLFDDYLRDRAAKHKEDFHAFSLETDYRSYVDGKPRYDGVRSFLHSRRIDLPYGDPTDGPEEETVCGLGNGKDRLFASVLREKGVKVFKSSLHLIERLKNVGVLCAVVSSSKNCRTVLEIAGIEGLFETRVDGVTSAELHLKGKPAPDIFLKCAELLTIPADRCVIVEDSISGVQAGWSGGFGLVVGVDRVGFAEMLRRSGADVVVADLVNVSPNDIDRWCAINQRNSSRVSAPRRGEWIRGNG